MTTTTTAPATSAPTASGRSHEEAFATLTTLARRKCGAIPPELLARHVLAAYGAAADWPVLNEAMLALLRRAEFGRADGLRVAQRPANGPRGIYRTRRKRQPPRHYRTLLVDVDLQQDRDPGPGPLPILASCDCPDFLHGSLGLCKHVLTVLDALADRPRTFRSLCNSGPSLRGPRLRWDPIRPLQGAGDWLDRLRLYPSDGRPAATWQRIARKFTPGVDSDWVLKDTYADDPARRGRLVDTLLAAFRGNARIPQEPAVRALLHEEAALLGQGLALHKQQRRLERGLATLARPLYPYQRDGVDRFLATGRLLLADDMGLGKTVQAVAVCTALWNAGAVRRGLLIVPASLKFQWQREWQSFSDVPVQVVEGPPEDRRAMYGGDGFLIANYEQVLRDLDTMQGWHPDVVVLDEAQRIKNWATKTANCVKQLRPRYRMVLTGTPFENRLMELASVVEWVDPRALEPKWRLPAWHTIGTEGSRSIVGARNLDVLRERLEPVMLRRRRTEILTQLPPRTDSRIAVQLTEDQRQAHDDLAQPIARLIATAQRRPLTQPEFLRLMSLLTTQRVIANGIAQLDFANVWPGIAGVERPDAALLDSLRSPKLVELRELIARIAVEQERKIVVFSQWRRMLKLSAWATQDLMRDAGLRSVFFTGAESQKRRVQNVVDFHDDPDTRVLFATDAGGVGLNLQRAASCCIQIELPWNPAVLEQRIARIHRLGQECPIDVYHLVAEDCIESRIATVVADKSALFTTLFDGSSDEIQFDGSGSFLQGIAKLTDTEETARPQADPDAAVEERLEAMVAAADDAELEEGPVEVEVIPAVASVQNAFQHLDIRPTRDGGLRIEAPPEAAQTLVELFQGMADLLKRATG